MKKVTIYFTLLLSIFFTTVSFGTEISPTAELRRASLLLRGQPPSPAEYDQVLKSQNQRQTINDIIQTYLKSNQFTLRMRIRLQELFRLKQETSFHKSKIPGPSEESQNINYSGSPNYAYGNTNALDQLFFDIISKNLSWDSLLVSKQYQFKKFNSSNFRMSDLEFFRWVFNEEISTVTQNESGFINLEAKNDKQKSVLAGSITTSRFYQRNQTTKINKNRRRAAAVFRTFLCDDLKPVILPDASEDKELLKLALEGYIKKDNQEISNSEERKHAEDPQCQSCHYKLDPLAKTFRGSSLVLNSEPAPGTLVFRRRDGSMVNIPANGIGQLAEEITKQPEYVQCQVKHFWNWFIGKDVYLSAKRHEELVESFNKLGRRPLDFVSALISSAEFRTIPAENQLITYSHVEPILQSCNQCHVDKKSKKNKAPDLGKYPFANDNEDNKDLLKDVSKSIDLKSMGMSKSMPPEEAGWKLSVDDFNILKMWISQGARDDEGKVYLNAKEVNQFLPSDQQNNKLYYKPTFDDTYYRYLSGYDFFASVMSLAPNYSENIYIADLRALGFKNPATGSPYISAPNAATIDKISKGVRENINNFTNTFDSNLFGIPSDQRLAPWKNFDEKMQAIIISKAIEYAIGPQVMSAQQQEKMLSMIKTKINSDEKNQYVSALDVFKKVLFLILSSERFQTL